MTARAARAPRLDYEPVDDRRNICSAETDARLKQAEAGLAQAEATQRLAQALESATEAFQPAAEAIHALGVAQQRFCAFLVKHRLKLALSIPSVLVAVGAISPNAAHSVAVVLKALGLS